MNSTTEELNILYGIKKAINKGWLRLREGNEEYLFLEWALPVTASETFNVQNMLKDYNLIVNISEADMDSQSDELYQKSFLEIEYREGDIEVPVCEIPLDQDFFILLFTRHVERQNTYKNNFIKYLGKID